MHISEQCYKSVLDYLLHEKYQTYKNSRMACYPFFSRITVHIKIFICRAR